MIKWPSCHFFISFHHVLLLSYLWHCIDRVTANYYQLLPQGRMPYMDVHHHHIRLHHNIPPFPIPNEIRLTYIGHWEGSLSLMPWDHRSTRASETIPFCRPCSPMYFAERKPPISQCKSHLFAFMYLTDNTFTLVEVMVWCQTGTYHYQNQWWPSSPMKIYGKICRGRASVNHFFVGISIFYNLPSRTIGVCWLCSTRRFFSWGVLWGGAGRLLESCGGGLGTLKMVGIAFQLRLFL